MKIIHRDPALHAQRVAAIKKAKGTPVARKHASETLKTFFSDPENRRKRSISMKGVRFFCKNCGQEGHRSYYCPEHGENTDRRFRCGSCGEKGHNRRTCQRPRTSKPKQRILSEYHCRACGKLGHNRRTCSLKTELQSDSATPENAGTLKDSTGYVRKDHHRCSVCGKSGHNRRTCFLKTERQGSDSAAPEIIDSLNIFEGHAQKHNHQCSVCKKSGHNRRTCSLKTELQSGCEAPENKGSHKDTKVYARKHRHLCSVCGESGHNRRTCSQHSIEEFNKIPRVSQRARRPYHCRICGVLGHNRRTCAENRAVSSVNIKDESTF